MIIDQLFEDEKKKKLNEIDPRNYDSDEDYYNDLYGDEGEDDEDFDSDADDVADMDNDEESYYEKSLRSRGLGESKQRRLNEDLLMEATVFRQARQFGQLLVEYDLTKAQVEQLFKDVEQGATAAGNNRTGLGKAKDATTNAIGSVKNMLASARKWVKERPTYQAVDTEYNRAMTALGKAGGENGEANAITKAIYKYRDAAKNYPRAAGLAKWAIITAAGLATGGLGGAGVAAGLAAIDSALKDKEIVDIVGDAASAALVSGAVQGASELGSMASNAYNGIPSGSEIAANNAALGNWNDTDIPGGAASNINGLDLPPDAAAAGDATPNIVGPEVENLSPEELANAAAQAKAYGFDGDVTLDQLNQAIMQTAEPGTVPADYSQMGAGAGGTTYTVTADDFKGLGKIAQDNGLTAQQLLDANPQITNPDKIFIGQEINIPAASGEPVKNVWQDWEGGTKPTAPAVEPGPNDTVPELLSKPTNPLPAAAGSTERYIPQKDGSWVDASTGKVADPAKLQASQDAVRTAFRPRPSMQGLQESVWSKVAESVKIKVLPADLLIDNKFTVLTWALNESTNREMGRSLQLTKLGVRTVFENIGRYRRVYLKEYTGAPTAAYGHPTAAGAPADAIAGQSKQGWFGRQLDTIGRSVDKVGKWASNAGHNVITKVTADKLNSMWNRAGEPYDSNKLYQLLITDWSVPKEVVDSVFSKMGIPYTTGVAGTPAPQEPNRVGSLTGINKRGANVPYTGNELYALQTKNMAKDEINAGLPSMTNPDDLGKTDKLRATVDAELAGKPSVTPTSTPSRPTTTPAASTFPGEDPTGPNYLGRREVAKRQAARAAQVGATPAAKTPNFAQQGGGYKSVNYAPNVKTGASLLKPAAPAAPAAAKAPATPQLSKDEYVKRIMATNESKQPVAETVKQVKRMMETVTTKADVQHIKDYIDYHMGTNLTEDARLKRNRLLSEVTQLAAVRRREIARRLA